jgi:hypothetical protein
MNIVVLVRRFAIFLTGVRKVELSTVCGYVALTVRHTVPVQVTTIQVRVLILWYTYSTSSSSSSSSILNSAHSIPCSSWCCRPFSTPCPRVATAGGISVYSMMPSFNPPPSGGHRRQPSLKVHQDVLIVNTATL